MSWKAIRRFMPTISCGLGIGSLLGKQQITETPNRLLSAVAATEKCGRRLRTSLAFLCCRLVAGHVWKVRPEILAGCSVALRESFR
jgi:hypothetical protein